MRPKCSTLQGLRYSTFDNACYHRVLPGANTTLWIQSLRDSAFAYSRFLIPAPSSFPKFGYWWISALDACFRYSSFGVRNSTLLRVLDLVRKSPIPFPYSLLINPHCRLVYLVLCTSYLVPQTFVPPTLVLPNSSFPSLLLFLGSWFSPLPTSPPSCTFPPPRSNPRDSKTP